MKPSEALDRVANEIIPTPDRWCKHAYARDESGYAVGIHRNGRPIAKMWADDAFHLELANAIVAAMNGGERE